jgi:hypothetical protein
VARTKAIFKPQPGVDRLSWLDAIDRFIATLVFDSRVQPVALRYSGTDDRINLTFAADQAELDLQAERIAQAEGADRWRIMGQVTSLQGDRGDLSVPVAITRAGSKAVVAETVADARGGFTFETTPGRYDILIQTPQGVMVASNIDID